jgi:alcohol dehydrogenase (quinone), cytochrome c subunit
MKTTFDRVTRSLIPAFALMCGALPGSTQAQTSKPQPALTSADAQLAQGAYLAKVGDCAACHTADKAKPFAGGLPLATPFGTLYSTNITADPSTGIGHYRYEDFATALRRGIAKDGHRLYPAMPYPSYAKIDDADMHALYRYFMHGVKPVTQANRAAALRFPFNVRSLMTVWDRLYAHDPAPYEADPRHSVEWNRGAYLVQGLAHCGACHTPHGVLGEERALDEKDNTAFLSGGALAGWYAPSLRGLPAQPANGYPGWSKAQLVAYLRSGRLHDGAAFGPMTEVIDNSTQYLRDDDLDAIATYLTSPSLQPRATPIEAKYTEGSDATAATLRAGHIDSTGARLYLDNCSACHRTDGTGAMPAFPSLNGNPVVLGSDPASLIHIVLSGSHMPSTAAAPTPLAMPDFGWRLTDQQVADLLTFVRSSWGNQADAVDAADVRKIRAVAAHPN